MDARLHGSKVERLIGRLQELWRDSRDQEHVSRMLHALDSRYELSQKMAREPALEDIFLQMAGRLANAFRKLSDIQGKRILDIACGSNTSRLPSPFRLDTLPGELKIGRPDIDYTALFEPWFCRMLFELGADPVGVDIGDLQQEVFEHYRVDLGRISALDFLPLHSFDAVQDSRLFGSPEFTAQFPNPADRLRVAREIRQQERRLLKPHGIVIHSDAAALVE